MSALRRHRRRGEARARQLALGLRKTISGDDLAAAVGFDREKALASIRQTAPKAAILEVSAKSGAGLDAWYAWLAG